MHRGGRQGYIRAYQTSIQRDNAQIDCTDKGTCALKSFKFLILNGTHCGKYIHAKDCFGFLNSCWSFLTLGLVNHNATRTTKSTLVRNARELEKASGLSKRDFFLTHGFVLLDHSSAMNADDWLASSQPTIEKIGRMTQDELTKDVRFSDTPAKKIYADEVETLIRKLLPDAVQVFAPAKGLRRGPDAEDSFVAVAHSDLPIKLEAWKTMNKSAFLSGEEEYQHLLQDHYMQINFWRPVLPMQKPCVDRPLGLLDQRAVCMEDWITTDFYGQQFLCLRHSPKHKWYYYPDMTTDEVLVFNQFYHVKGEAVGRMPVAHTAFHDPTSPEDCEKRCSFEYRVGVLLK